MKASSQHSVVSVGPNASVWHVADEMDVNGVGSVVVVDDDGAPVGIITDRDLVRRVVARDLDEREARAADVMSGNLVLGDLGESGTLLLERMRKHGVRRIPLLQGGRLAGVASLDDILAELSAQLWNVSEAIRIELRENARTTAKRRRAERRAEMVEELRHYMRDVEGSKKGTGELRSFLDWLSRGPS